MNKQEIQNQIQVPKKELVKPNISPEERFLQLVDIHNVSTKTVKDEFPYSIFFFNGETFLAEYDKTYPGKIWIDWRIWEVFEDEYGMKYLEVEEFMKERILEHFGKEVKEALWFASDYFR